MRHVIHVSVVVATLSLLTAGYAAGAIPTAERDALIALYTSTGGPYWDNNGGWLDPPGTECTWHGVMCDPGENNVEELHLAFNNLVGPLPAEIEDLTMLRVMVLAFNGVNGGLPPEIGNLSQLENIEMAGNQLTGSIPPEIGNLSSVHNLDFNWNHQTGQLPPELGNLTNLHALRLGDNQFEGPIPPEFGNMAELRDLDLWGNQLTGGIPPELGDLANLMNLSIDRNRLSGTIPAELGNLANLNWLNLESNNLSGLIPPDFGSLSSLVELFLGGNRLTGTIPPDLGNLVNLERLLINWNRIDGPIPPELGNLINLRELFLGGNRLSGPIPPELGNLVNLEGLHLRSNALVGEIPATITNMVSLGDDSSGIRYNGVFTADAGVGAFMDSKFGGNWRDTQTVVPENLSIDFTTGIAAGLRWDPIPYQWDPGSYDIVISDNINGPYDLIARTPGKNGADWVVFDLTPNTTYYFKLCTVTEPHQNNQNTIVSEFSSPISIATSADPSTWYAATTGLPGNDCTTPATACPSIQSAIELASPGEQILVAAGLYPGRTTIDRPIKISGDSSATTLLDGQGTETVFWINPGNHAMIIGVTVQNGRIHFGAGLYAEPFSTVEIVDSVFTDNHAIVQGGGLYLEFGGRMILDGVHFLGNSADERGGGFFVWDSAAAVMNSVVSGNTAPWGGGFFNAGSTTIEGTTFDGNVATDFGGGGLVNEGMLDMSHSSIINNSAAHGGGIANVGGAQMALENSTISGNVGGGLFNDQWARAELESCTIVNNSAPFAEHSGTMNWGELYLHNTILAANTPFNCANPVTSWGYNLEDDDTCGLGEQGDQSNVDPMLGPLADNGGPTLTHALPMGSPAIDAADPNDFPATDQRGFDRPNDGDSDGLPLPDVGAFENVQMVFTDGFESGDLTMWSSSVP